ncbi:hypothetical protein HDV06_001315, partial [Boothiomyces sp. JEL0866]
METQICASIDMGGRTSNWDSTLPKRIGQTSQYHMLKISLQFYTKEAKVVDVNEGVWEPLKFGTSAKINYFRLQGNPDYYYVDRFKLLLDPTNTQAVPLPPGVTLAKVMSDFLAYMKSTAEDIIKHHQGHNNDPVQWVVTVPAIWSPTAKAKTRQACFDCGMIDSLESSKLLLCYEPQAASIFIQKNSPFMAPNDVVVTLDIGGGTTDITSHEVLDSGDHAEIIPPAGALAGSVHIDKAFLDFVQRLVGPECYQT